MEGIPSSSRPVLRNATQFCANLPQKIPDSVDPRDTTRPLSRPMSQKGCGMCWVMAVSGALQDVAVVYGKHPKLPQVSPTVFAAQFPQHGCYGGSLLQTANDICAQGFVLASCGGEESVRSDGLPWCQTPMCLGLEPDDGSMNALIPKRLMCNGGRRLRVLETLYEPSDSDQHGLRRIVTHVGAVVVGVLLYENFSSYGETFAQKHRSVYIDSIDYEYYETGQGTVSNPLRPDKCLGLHAMSVVGYGIERNVELPDGRLVKELPYWLVRNSWGEKWGDGGYAKVAAFPYCKQGCAIGIAVDEYVRGKWMRGGDVLALKVGSFKWEPPVNYEVTIDPPVPGKKMRSRVRPIVLEQEFPKKKETINWTLILISCIVPLVLLVVLLFIKMWISCDNLKLLKFKPPPFHGIRDF